MPVQRFFSMIYIRMFLTISILLIPWFCMAQTLPPPPCGNEKALVLTHILESSGGAVVGLTYRALNWGPLTMRAIEADDEQTKEFRMYYTERVAPNLGLIRTNVMLSGPGFQLAPGLYQIGFKYLGKQQWAFTVHSDNPGRVGQTAPIQVATELTESSFLTMNWMPGKSEAQFDLVILYGPYKVTLPIQVSGIPTTSVGGMFDLQSGNHSAESGVEMTSPAETMSASPVMSVTTPDSRVLMPRLSPSQRWEARSPTPVKRAESGVDR